ncbi:MAG: DNA gyrase C-terminal beta-propeller domain-containing protein [Polyangiales bacterium]
MRNSQILVIREELEEKKKKPHGSKKLLKSPTARWNLIKAELTELADSYPQPRRTKIVANLDEPEFVAEDFIVDEDTFVLVTEQGWVKRQGSVKDVDSTRVRKGDRVKWVAAGSTKASVAFFSSKGVCYVARMADIEQTTGHGQPVQSLFKMGDGERVVGVIGMDPRFLDVPAPTEGAEEPEAPYGVAVTKLGMTLRFSLRAHRDPSTRSGRKFTRPKDDDDVIYVAPCHPDAAVGVASRSGRALICESEEIALLSGAGRGVMMMKLQKDDELIAARILEYEDDVLIVQKDGGSEYKIAVNKYEIVSRGGKGFQLFKRGELSEEVYQAPRVPSFEDDVEGEE